MNKPLTINAIKYWAIAFLLYALASCATQHATTPEEEIDSGPTDNVDLSQVLDAVPKQEVWARYGNHTPYFVLGETYEVMESNENFKQDGIASWYGTKFHGELTSTRDLYDMYEMTAAHKTLPLPSYVLVTNTENQKQVVVLVNDRGPFKEGRIIDLSYAAAHRIDMHEQGTAQVRIEVLPPFIHKPIKPQKDKHGHVVIREVDFPKGKTNYLQIGVYANQITANELQSSLVRDISKDIIVLKSDIGARALYKVRIGPIEDYANLKTIQAVLKERNLPHHYLISE